MRLGDLDLLKEEIEDNKWSWLRNADKGKVLYLIKRQPTINPEDLRPKGKWEWNSDDEPYCTNCNEKADLDSYEFVCRGKVRWSLSTFCPNCGAKMEG